MEWLDGSVWRVVKARPPAQNFGDFLTARWFAGRSKFRLRLRVVAGPHAAPAVVELMMWACTGTQGNVPSKDAGLTYTITEVAIPSGSFPVG